MPESNGLAPRSRTAMYAGVASFAIAALVAVMVHPGLIGLGSSDKPGDVSMVRAPLPAETSKVSVPASTGPTPSQSGVGSPTSAVNPTAKPIGRGPSAGVRVCGSASLKGPATAPAGAITVKPSQNLADVVDAHGSRKTYWLAPGVFKLGTNEFDQVGPHAGDRFIGSPGAILDGQHKNRYAFGGDAPNVTIEHLTVQNFGAPGWNNNEGVVNHDQARGWTITDTTIRHVAGAGVMLGTDNRLLRSCLQENGQYGFNGFALYGAANILLDGNEIVGNNTDDWEKRSPGCGCTGGGKFWEVKGARVVNNNVHGNHGAGLWADTNNSGFLFQNNYIADNEDEGLMYETSYNAAIKNNTFVRNALIQGPKNPGFPTAAIYLSEAGSDPRAPGPYGSAFDVSGNTFIDNWSGIIVWENADRFAGSPANSSTGTTTMVNPAATEKACSTPALVAKTPYVNDCRWKSLNIRVSGNTFTFNAAHLPGCRPSTGCGYNGVFSQVGTVPSWSPYKDYVVPKNITYHQNNIWTANSYTGPWSFMAYTLGNTVTYASWQGKFHQDAGSKLTRS